MYMNFIGVLEVGDKWRCGADGDEPGSILIGGKDFVDEVLDVDWPTNTTVYVDGVEIAKGSMNGMLGSGYSEYTPIDADELSLGDVDVIGELLKYEGKKVNVVVSDEDLPEMD